MGEEGGRRVFVPVLILGNSFSETIASELLNLDINSGTWELVLLLYLSKFLHCGTQGPLS